MTKSMYAIMLFGAVLLNSVAQANLVDMCDAVSAQSQSVAIATAGSSASAPVEFTMNGEMNSTFTITTTNESDITWTGYIVELDPTGPLTFVEGTAGSTRFGTIEYPDLWTIEFWAPEEVPPGDVVTLQFDVNLPDSVPQTFTVTHTIIPEPATAALLGLGALALLARRRK
jgi:hypothetical protein